MALPELHLHNCQERVALDIEALKSRATSALPLVLSRPGPETAVLPDLDEIEISLVSDEDISDVHGRFLNDPSPTDVITFHHGEILVSADTACRTAPSWNHGTDREVLLYLIHGLLHLNGHEDRSESGAARMKQEQESILAEVWPNPAPRN